MTPARSRPEIRLGQIGRSDVKGWCPGALRPMPSGDGLIVRVRLQAATLSVPTARALAECAADFGNGSIDLTSRANLQIRGVTDETLAPLQGRLDALALLDRDPEIEAVRNILVSPLAGVDPTALLDARLYAKALDAQLQSATDLRGLPAKFGFAVDGGGMTVFATDCADVVFRALKTADGVSFEISLGGAGCSVCACEDLPLTAMRIARAFDRLRQDAGAHRMAALAQAVGVERILREAGLPTMGGDPGEVGSKPLPLGLFRIGDRQALVVGAPFGRLEPDGLVCLAGEAERASGELRLTPWRSIALVGRAFDDDAMQRVAQKGFVLDDAAPLRAVAACPGAKGCASATVDTRADAARLAAGARGLALRGIALHVSGCAKGCAHPAPAPLTLVGREGRYDAIIHGAAHDEPTIKGLSLVEAEALVAAYPRKVADLPDKDMR